jgi:casein kinase II subunit alpha
MLPHLKYTLTDHVYSTTVNERVVIKHAPEVRLRREKEILRQFEGDASIRQLIDHGKDSPLLVLEHLDSDALRLSRKARLSKQDIRLIARSILSALGSLHAKGIAHTGNAMRFLCR